MNAKEGRDWEPCLIHDTPTLFLMKRQPLPHPHPSCHPFFCFSPCLEIFQNVEEKQQGWGGGSGVTDNPWGLLLYFPGVLHHLCSSHHLFKESDARLER